MNYPHYIRIYRAGGDTTGQGEQNDDTGRWTDDTTLPDDAFVTKGRADVQDMGIRIDRTTAGMPVLEADYTVFMRTESKIKRCKIGDLVTIEWNDERPDTTARITKVRTLDGSLLLQQV